MAFKEISFPGENTQYIFVDEKALTGLTRVLARKIIDSAARIDRLIVLGKGGWTPGRSLIGYLGLEDAFSIGIKQGNKINHKTKPEPVIYQDLPEEIKKKLSGEKVLIVDDLTDSGDQLDFVVEYLDKLGVSQVITAALFKKPSSTAKVDHWAETTSAWIIFAYEAIETMKELAAKWQKQGITDEEIKHRFIEIGFDQEDIDLYRQSRQVADRA